MSIHVTDFKWEKGKNDLQYIELLEKTLKNEQAITAKAVAKIRELSKENKEIRNKAIDEFAETVKKSQNAHLWCCRDSALEFCSGDDCKSCMDKFKKQIDEIAEEMRGAE